MLRWEPYEALQLKPPFTSEFFSRCWHLKALWVSFCPLGSPYQSKFSKWKEATRALFYGLQLFLQLNFQCGTLLRTASEYHTAKLRNYLTRLKTCYCPDTDKKTSGDRGVVSRTPIYQTPNLPTSLRCFWKELQKSREMLVPLSLSSYSKQRVGSFPCHSSAA